MENEMNNNAHQDEEATANDLSRQEADAPQQHQSTGRQKIEMNRLRTSIPAPVWLAALTLALVASVVSSLAEAAAAGSIDAPFAFLQPLRAVPDWLTTGIWCVIYIAITITFYRNLRHVKAMARPLLIAGVCMAVCLLFSIPTFDSSFFEGEMNIPMILMIALITLMGVIVLSALLVLAFLLPIRMLTRFTGRMRNVGKWGLAGIGVDLAAFAMSIVYEEYCDSTFAAVLYAAAMLCSFMVELFLLKSIYTLLVSND